MGEEKEKFQRKEEISKRTFQKKRKRFDEVRRIFRIEKSDFGREIRKRFV